MKSAIFYSGVVGTSAVVLHNAQTPEELDTEEFEVPDTNRARGTDTEDFARYTSEAVTFEMPVGEYNQLVATHSVGAHTPEGIALPVCANDEQCLIFEEGDNRECFISNVAMEIFPSLRDSDLSPHMHIEGGCPTAVDVISEDQKVTLNLMGQGALTDEHKQAIIAKDNSFDWADLLSGSNGDHVSAVENLDYIQEYCIDFTNQAQESMTLVSGLGAADPVFTGMGDFTNSEDPMGGVLPLFYEITDFGGDGAPRNCDDLETKYADPATANEIALTDIGFSWGLLTVKERNDILLEDAKKTKLPGLHGSFSASLKDIKAMVYDLLQKNKRQQHGIAQALDESKFGTEIDTEELSNTVRAFGYTESAHVGYEDSRSGQNDTILDSLKL